MVQRFMGSLLVVAGTKVLEGTLLPLPRRLRWTGCLCLQGPVESLQPPVLFRMSGLGTFWKDPQLDPPHRQGRESTQAYAGKGRPVVGADGPWETVFPEGPLQDPAHLGTSGLAQPVAREEIPRGGVLHRKGVDPHPISRAKPALEVDPHPISRAKPALEVDPPQVVGLLRLDKGLAPGRRPVASLAPTHQPGPVQQVPNRAGGWPRNPGLPVLQPSYQLLGAPGCMRLPGRDQALHHHPLRLVRMLTGRPARSPSPSQPQARKRWTRL